jgi:SAM-dependent methyltransferase
LKDYDTATYGDLMAGVYDEWFGIPDDTDDTVDFLENLAGSGPVLELGIGTGRVALPLAGRGVEVHGIDASGAMVERMKDKPGGAGITVSIGDFAEVAVGEHFSLVYVVFNTFFALASQEDQVRCFANVAGRLNEGGVFVLTAFVPDLGRFVGGQTTQTKLVERDRVILETSTHDPVAQKVLSQNIVMGETGTKLYPVQIRYAWPSELDLMARLAGMRLLERWAGWHREPYKAASPRHVSVYEKG